MAICVECERDHAVAEEFLNHLRVYASIQEVSRGGMTEIMNPNPRNPGLGERPVKPLMYPGAIDGAPYRRCEHEAGVVPLLPRC